jgi:hypothetical protein
MKISKAWQPRDLRILWLRRMEREIKVWGRSKVTLGIESEVIKY